MRATGTEATLRTAVALLLAAAALTASARVLMTREEALATAFARGVAVSRQSIFLKPEQIAAAKKESGVDFTDQLVVRYAGSDGSFAYFDTHRVRTEPETVMVVIGASGAIARVEILSFDEPTDYFPKRRWLEQFGGRKLDADLSLNRAIRPISGASLTGRSLVNASRKILALHHAIGASK